MASNCIFQIVFQHMCIQTFPGPSHRHGRASAFQKSPTEMRKHMGNFASQRWGTRFRVALATNRGSRWRKNVFKYDFFSQISLATPSILVFEFNSDPNGIQGLQTPREIVRANTLRGSNAMDKSPCPHVFCFVFFFYEFRSNPQLALPSNMFILTAC